MSKYDVWFCECGHIHLMPIEYLDWMSENYEHRNIIRVCQNCGETKKMWLTDYDDELKINCKDFINFEMCDNANTRFLLNKGIYVPLINGDCTDYATYYCNGVWFYESNKCKVNTIQLIKEIQYKYKDKADDILKSISGYVAGIDWTGTDYAE